MAPSKYETLTNSLYAACCHEATWTEFLESAADVFEATVAGFLHRSSISDGYIAGATTGLSDDVVRRYNEQFNTQDPWYLAFRSRKLSEWIGPGLCAPTDLAHTDFYHDFWKTSAPAWHQAAIILEEGTSSTVLTLHRDRIQSDFQPIDTEILTALTPHLRRGMKLHNQIHSAQHMLSQAARVLDALDTGLIGLDASGTVRYANAFAEQVLKSGKVLTIRDGKLWARGPGAARALETLIQSALRSGADSTGTQALSVGSGTETLIITAFPSPPRSMLAHWECRVLVSLTDQSKVPATRVDALRSVFRLTPTECKVSMLLLAGNDVPQIAAMSGMSQDAVRFHLKSIYGKTGVKRQGQLVRLLSCLPGRT